MVWGLALLITRLHSGPAIPPADTSTMSACTVSSLPPLADSILSSTPPFFSSALFTLMPSLNFMPCLPSERWKAFLISPSCTAAVSDQRVQDNPVPRQACAAALWPNGMSGIHRRSRETMQGMLAQQVLVGLFHTDTLHTAVSLVKRDWEATQCPAGVSHSP